MSLILVTLYYSFILWALRSLTYVFNVFVCSYHFRVYTAILKTEIRYQLYLLLAILCFYLINIILFTIYYSTFSLLFMYIISITLSYSLYFIPLFLLLSRVPYIIDIFLLLACYYLINILSLLSRY